MAAVVSSFGVPLLPALTKLVLRRLSCKGIKAKLKTGGGILFVFLKERMKDDVNPKEMIQMRVPVPPWPHSGVRGAWGGERQGEVSWKEERIGWEAQKQEHTLRLSQQPLSSAASGGRWQKFKGGGWKEKPFKIAKRCFFFSLGCDRPRSQGVPHFLFFWLSHTFGVCFLNFFFPFLQAGIPAWMFCLSPNVAVFG